jgi:hypothetical protein
MFQCNTVFPTFLAGLQEAFDYVMLYVAIEDITVIRLLVHMNEDHIDNFSLGPFEFHLENMAHASTRYFTDQITSAYYGGGKQFKQLRAFRKCRLRKFLMGKH